MHLRIADMHIQELIRRFETFPEVTTKVAYVPPDVKLYLTIWTLGNQDSFRAIGDRFGMMKGKKRQI